MLTIYNGVIFQFVQTLGSQNLRYRKKMGEMTEFVRFHNLPGELAKRVIGYVDFSFSVTNGIDVEQLSMQLPAHLQLEIQLAINQKMVEQVRAFEGSPKSFFEQLVMKLQPCTCLCGDTIFYQGEEGDRMYFVKRGMLHSRKRGLVHSVLQDGDHFGEGSLLTETRERSTEVVCASDCMLLSLSIEDFEYVLKMFPAVAVRIRQPAKRRSSDLNYAAIDQLRSGSFLRNDPMQRPRSPSKLQRASTNFLSTLTSTSSLRSRPLQDRTAALEHSFSASPEGQRARLSRQGSFISESSGEMLSMLKAYTDAGAVQTSGSFVKSKSNGDRPELNRSRTFSGHRGGSSAPQDEMTRCVSNCSQVKAQCEGSSSSTETQQPSDVSDAFNEELALTQSTPSPALSTLCALPTSAPSYTRNTRARKPSVNGTMMKAAPTAARRTRRQSVNESIMKRQLAEQNASSEHGQQSPAHGERDVTTAEQPPVSNPSPVHSMLGGIRFPWQHWEADSRSADKSCEA